jgi:sialate O-acetylesterase
LGWSAPGDTVKVEFASGTAGSNGKWQVKVQLPAAGGPNRLKVGGKQTVELHDVLVGDVWIYAEQSQYAVRSRGGEECAGRNQER